MVPTSRQRTTCSARAASRSELPEENVHPAPEPLLVPKQETARDSPRPSAPVRRSGVRRGSAVDADFQAARPPKGPFLTPCRRHAQEGSGSGAGPRAGEERPPSRATEVRSSTGSGGRSR